VCAGVLALSGCGGVPAPLADEALPQANAAVARERIRVPLAPERIRVEVRVSAVTPHTLQIPVTRGIWSAPRGRLHESLIELELGLDGVTSQPQKIADIAKSKFLNVAEFPRGRIEGRWLRPRPSSNTSHELFFDLVLKHRRRHLVAPAALSRVACDVRMTTVFRFDRRAFDIIDSGNYDRLVGNDLEVSIEVSTPTAPFGVGCLR
jgi:hypothetical protein